VDGIWVVLLVAMGAALAVVPGGKTGWEEVVSCCSVSLLGWQ